MSSHGLLALSPCEIRRTEAFFYRLMDRICLEPEHPLCIPVILHIPGLMTMDQPVASHFRPKSKAPWRKGGVGISKQTHP